MRAIFSTRARRRSSGPLHACAPAGAYVVPHRCRVQVKATGEGYWRRCRAQVKLLAQVQSTGEGTGAGAGPPKVQLQGPGAGSGVATCHRPKAQRSDAKKKKTELCRHETEETFHFYKLCPPVWRGCRSCRSGTRGFILLLEGILVCGR